MADIRPIHSLTVRDRTSFGGKAWRLAQLMQAGLPVPHGFCIGAGALDPIDRAGILAAYHVLGGIAAVRSSSAGEDGDSLSFAGQFESVLDVQGDERLLDAIRQCWQSRYSRRVGAYRNRWFTAGAEPMGVIVQRYIRAEWAGVLFTRHPHADDEMLLEAARGESSVVESGHGVPVPVRIDRKTGAVRSDSESAIQVLAEKLFQFGTKIEGIVDSPCDIEWAFADGQLWILQARPITTPSVAERESYRRTEIASARRAAQGDETVWIQDNLAETLPHPTPMTWSMLQQLLGASGGLGQMYRELGIDPDPALGNRSAYDLIVGRPYLNLQRSAQMQFAGVPLGYSFERIKTAPASLPARQPVWRHDRACGATWFRLPLILRQLRRRKRALEKQFHEIPAQFEKTIQEYSQALEPVAEIRFEGLTDDELQSHLRSWCDTVFVTFGRHLFLPAALADYALARLRAVLPPEAADTRIVELLATIRLNSEIDVARGLADLAAGNLTETEFRARFGHRAEQEMDLAAPRYSEWPSPIIAPQTRLASERQRRNVDFAADASTWADRLVAFAALREAAKHHFLRGYVIIRRILLQLDRRLSLAGGIFFLWRPELENPKSSAELSALIAERRRRWAALRALPAPDVLFSDALDAIGRAPEALEQVKRFDGLPLSPGVGEAPALVLDEPDGSAPNGPYVLVCRNCDPAWTALLMNARAAVFEQGGLLSHGAIVAREFGVPAVGAAENATQRIRKGQVVRVDGSVGTVTWRPPQAAATPARNADAGRA